MTIFNNISLELTNEEQKMVEQIVIEALENKGSNFNADKFLLEFDLRNYAKRINKTINNYIDYLLTVFEKYYFSNED